MNLIHFFSKLDSKSNKQSLTSYILLVSYVLLFLCVVLANRKVSLLKGQLSITSDKIERYQSYILSQINNPLTAKELDIAEYISDKNTTHFKVFIPQSVCVPCAISLLNALIEGHIPANNICIYLDKYNPAIYNEAKMRSINNIVVLEFHNIEDVVDIILVKEDSNQAKREIIKYKDGYQDIINEFIINNE